MHHYRCQNVYISSTASEIIVDTLVFFPHNLPMPQISSTDRLLMASHDMTDALKHHHHDSLFATYGYYTSTSLAQLATIFKNKFQKPVAPEFCKHQLRPLKTNDQWHCSNRFSLRQSSISTEPDHKTKSAQDSQPTFRSLKTHHNFRGWSHRW
jgi:hypothetical protein